jgi:hypothetical protein
VKTLPGANIDPDQNLLVAMICISVNKIMKFQKASLRWDLENLHAQRRKVQDNTEEKLVALEC